MVQASISEAFLIPPFTSSLYSIVLKFRLNSIVSKFRLNSIVSKPSEVHRFRVFCIPLFPSFLYSIV